MTLGLSLSLSLCLFLLAGFCLTPRIPVIEILTFLADHVVENTALSLMFFLVALFFGGIYAYRAKREGMPEDDELKEVPPVVLG